jgi:hypothetical protein
MVFIRLRLVWLSTFKSRNPVLFVNFNRVSNNLLGYIFINRFILIPLVYIYIGIRMSYIYIYAGLFFFLGV